MDVVIHKSVRQIQTIGPLRDQVLCWRSYPHRALETIRNAQVATSINDATCPDCWELWKEGNYDGTQRPRQP